MTPKKLPSLKEVTGTSRNNLPKGTGTETAHYQQLLLLVLHNGLAVFTLLLDDRIPNNL